MRFDSIKAIMLYTFTMKKAYFHYDNAEASFKVRPGASVNIPGSMTQEEINARNDFVIAHQAKHNPNLAQRSAYLGVLANQRHPLEDYYQIGSDFAKQFYEPGRVGAYKGWNFILDNSLPALAWKSFTGNPLIAKDSYIRNPKIPFTGMHAFKKDYDPNSYFLDAANRMYYDWNPEDVPVGEDGVPLTYTYKNDALLDGSANALNASVYLAGTAATAGMGPHLAAVGTAGRNAVLATRAGQAASHAARNSRAGQVALNAIDKLRHSTQTFSTRYPRVERGAREAWDTFWDFTIPGYAARPAYGSSQWGKFLAPLGVWGAGSHFRDAYTHGKQEAALTGNTTHGIGAGFEHLITGAPVSPVGIVGGVGGELLQGSMPYILDPREDLQRAAYLTATPFVSRLFHNDQTTPSEAERSRFESLDTDEGFQRELLARAARDVGGTAQLEALQQNNPDEYHAAIRTAYNAVDLQREQYRKLFQALGTNRSLVNSKVTQMQAGKPVWEAERRLTDLYSPDINRRRAAELALTGQFNDNNPSAVVNAHRVVDAAGGLMRFGLDARSPWLSDEQLYADRDEATAARNDKLLSDNIGIFRVDTPGSKVEAALTRNLMTRGYASDRINPVVLGEQLMQSADAYLTDVFYDAAKDSTFKGLPPKLKRDLLKQLQKDIRTQGIQKAHDNFMATVKQIFEPHRKHIRDYPSTPVAPAPYGHMRPGGHSAPMHM